MDCRRLLLCMIPFLGSSACANPDGATEDTSSGTDDSVGDVSTAGNETGTIDETTEGTTSDDDATTNGSDTTNDDTTDGSTTDTTSDSDTTSEDTTETTGSEPCPSPTIGGCYGPALILDIAGINPMGISIGDLDGDSDGDVATANRLTDNSTVLFGDGMGGFVSPGSFPTLDSAQVAHSADFDDNGVDDVIVGNSGFFVVLLGTGIGPQWFTATPQVNTGNGISNFALGDVDGDANVDVVTASYNLQVNNIHIHRGNGQGGFSTATVSTNIAGSRSPELADFTGDGNLDVVVIALGLRVFPGDGSGMVGPGSIMSPSIASFVVVAGEFTGDGQMDVLTSHNTNPSELSIGQGNGLFGAPQPIGISAGNAMASADFDNDGDDDAVVAIPGSCFGCTDAGVVFYRNDAGTLVEEASVDTGELQASSIAVGDLNGDDIPDLAFGHDDALQPDIVTVLLSAP
ncbi:FG-GAP repeat domain-containing protein [Nannocystaceae bacterium ST9]